MVGWLYSFSYYYVPDRREGGNKRCFCPSVRQSVRLSVSLSVAYTANNSRIQTPSVPKFGRKVPHLGCDWHTNFKVKWSKVRVRGGRGYTVSAEPVGHTACMILMKWQLRYKLFCRPLWRMLVKYDP